MKSTKEPIIFDELKEGIHKIRNGTYSKINPDGTYNIVFNDKVLATIFFEGSVKVYAQPFNKTEAARKRLNLILEPVGKIMVSVNGQWLICNKSKNRADTNPKLFVETLMINR